MSTVDYDYTSIFDKNGARQFNFLARYLQIYLTLGRQ